MAVLWLLPGSQAGGLSTANALLDFMNSNQVPSVCTLPLSFLLPRVNVRRLLDLVFFAGIAFALGLLQGDQDGTRAFVQVGMTSFGSRENKMPHVYWSAGTSFAALRSKNTSWCMGVKWMGATPGEAIGKSFVVFGRF